MSTERGSSFGLLLRRSRRAAGLTQEALAERAHLSVYTVSALERGANQTPRADTVALLAGALQLAPRERTALETAACRLRTPLDSRPSLQSRSSTPYVGRTLELALLERHLAGEGPPALLLAGEPGIGKSRLLAEAHAPARAAGWTELAGGCQRHGDHEPYAPLLGALQRYVGTRTPADLRSALAGCAWLVRLLPELAAGPIEPLPAWTLPPAQERRLMVAAVLRLLRNAAGPSGTLLLLDDLHWAGPDALDLLSALVRASDDTPLRVIGAYRDTEVRPGEPLGILLADLAQAGLAQHHALAPLAPVEAGQLLAGLLAGEEREAGETEMEPALAALVPRVVQRAGGVPFYLVSYARGLQAGLGESIPWDLAQGLRQRVAALSGEAQEVLGVAAVLGRVVQPGELIAVAEQPQGVVLAALEAAERARLLVADGRTYRFAHDLIRDTVEADVGLARQLLLHRRAAEVLAQEVPCPLERVAYHYGHSAAPRQAVPYLEQAGDQARTQGAYAAAEGYYRAALDGLGGVETTGTSSDAARLQAGLGELLRLTGRSSEALRVLDQAAASYRASGETERLADVMALVGRAHEQRGTNEEGLRALQEAVAVADAQGSARARAVVYLAQARMHNHLGQYREQRAMAGRAAALARTAGDERLLARTLHSYAVPLRFLAPGAEEQGYQEAARLAEACGDVETLSGILYHLAVAMLLRGAFDQAMAHVERSLELRTQFSDQVAAAHTRTVRGMIHLYSGAWREAEADLQQALQLSRETDTALLAATTLTILAHLRVLQGRGGAARRCLADAAGCADPEMTTLAQRVRAELHLMEGHPAAARAQFAPLLSAPNGDRRDHAFILPSLAWAELQVGDMRAAAATAAKGAALARAERNNLALADALRVQARVAVEQQKGSEAAQALEEGLALTRRIRYPFVEARLLHVYGELRRQEGEHAAAHERWQGALAIFRRLGARKDAEVEQSFIDLSAS